MSKGTDDIKEPITALVTQQTKLTGVAAFETLCESRKLFVLEYVQSFDKRKAIIASGSIIQDRQQQLSHASHMLVIPEVKEAVLYLMDRIGITPERIKSAIAKVAFACDAADFGPYERGEMTLEQLRDSGVDTSLIKSVSVSPGKFGDARSVEFHDAMKARESLARIMSMFQDTRNIKVSGEVRIIDMTKMSTEELERLAHATEQDAIDVECEPAVKQLPEK